MKKQILVLSILTYAVLVIEANAQRANVGAHFYFELDGVNSGFLRSVDGGAVSAPVIEDSPAGNETGKHLGQPVYEPFRVRYDFAAANGAVSDWISAAWNRDFQRKNGVIITTDYDLRARFRREFSNAL